MVIFANDKQGHTNLLLLGVLKCAVGNETHHWHGVHGHGSGGRAAAYFVHAYVCLDGRVVRGQGYAR